MWHGIIDDSWRKIVLARKKELRYSNAMIAERAQFLSESVVRNDLDDNSDPPLSHIGAIAGALDMEVNELFIPSLPNGMRIKALIEAYVRLVEENAELTAKNETLSDRVEELRMQNDSLKDELLGLYRNSK